MQAIGATTPAFTAALSLIILRTKESGRTYIALLPVVIGIVIATGAEPSFNLAGFSAAVVATSARAFKSVLQVCACHCMCWPDILAVTECHAQLLPLYVILFDWVKVHFPTLL